MSSKSIEVLVPCLNGSSYHVWFLAMEAFFKSQGLWSLVSSLKVIPAELTEGASATTIATYPQKWLNWSNCNDQAIGYMQLHINQNLYNHAQATLLMCGESLKWLLGNLAWCKYMLISRRPFSLG